MYESPIELIKPFNPSKIGADYSVPIATSGLKERKTIKAEV